MSRKSKKQSIRGTYALCITVGLFVGLGLGPAFGNVILPVIAGAVLGVAAAYLLTHQRQKKTHGR